MWLKRIYDESEKFLGVKALSTSRLQNFTQSLITEGIAKGWMTVSKGRITIEDMDKPLDYVIAYGPAIYCCHCHEKIGECDEGASPAGAARLAAKVAADHPGVASPDPACPAGYRQDNFFACVLEGDEKVLPQDEAAELRNKAKEALDKKHFVKFGSKK